MLGSRVRKGHGIGDPDEGMFEGVPCFVILHDKIPVIMQNNQGARGCFYGHLLSHGVTPKTGLLLLQCATTV